MLLKQVNQVGHEELEHASHIFVALQTGVDVDTPPLVIQFVVPDTHATHTLFEQNGLSEVQSIFELHWTH